MAGSPVIGRRRGAFSTLLQRPGLRASSDGVLATKSERIMLASTCLYSLYAWFCLLHETQQLCRVVLSSTILAPQKMTTFRGLCFSLLTIVCVNKLYLLAYFVAHDLRTTTLPSAFHRVFGDHMSGELEKPGSGGNLTAAVGEMPGN